MGRLPAQGLEMFRPGVMKAVKTKLTIQQGISVGMGLRVQGFGWRGLAARGQGTCPGIPVARATIFVAALLGSWLLRPLVSGGSTCRDG